MLFSSTLLVSIFNLTIIRGWMQTLGRLHGRFILFCFSSFQNPAQQNSLNDEQKFIIKYNDEQKFIIIFNIAVHLIKILLFRFQFAAAYYLAKKSGKCLTAAMDPHSFKEEYMLDAFNNDKSTPSLNYSMSYSMSLENFKRDLKFLISSLKKLNFLLKI